MTDNKRIKVADLPPALNKVCMERGAVPDDMLTPLEVMKDWSGWYLGHEDWAERIIRHYEDLTND